MHGARLSVPLRLNLVPRHSRDPVHETIDAVEAIGPLDGPHGGGLDSVIDR